MILPHWGARLHCQCPVTYYCFRKKRTSTRRARRTRRTKRRRRRSAVIQILVMTCQSVSAEIWTEMIWIHWIIHWPMLMSRIKVALGENDFLKHQTCTLVFGMAWNHIMAWHVILLRMMVRGTDMVFIDRMNGNKSHDIEPHEWKVLMNIGLGWVWFPG